MTNKVELTLITHKESSEMENFAFYFLLTNFQSIISMNLGAKKTVHKSNLIHLEICD